VEFILQINYKINRTLIVCLLLSLMTMRKVPGYIPGLIGIGILLMLALPALALPAAGLQPPSGGHYFTEDQASLAGKAVKPISVAFYPDISLPLGLWLTEHAGTGYHWMYVSSKGVTFPEGTTMKKIADEGAADQRTGYPEGYMLGFAFDEPFLKENNGIASITVEKVSPGNEIKKTLTFTFQVSQRD
jgi:hypothetical protein